MFNVKAVERNSGNIMYQGTVKKIEEVVDVMQMYISECCIEVEAGEDGEE